MAKLGDKLGNLLLKAGLVNPEQLTKALEAQRGTTKRLGEVLIELGFVKEPDLVMALSRQLGIPYATKNSGLLQPRKDEGLEKLVPSEVARQYLALPLSRHLNSLTVACVNPLDLLMIDNLTRLTGCEIYPVVTTRPDLEEALALFYGTDSMLNKAIGESYQIIETEIDEGDEVLNLDRLKEAAQEAPVIRLVDLIIRQAITDRASDIHIEPFRENIRIRYRIDGVLYEIAPPAKQLHAAIISRIKILCKLDIAEKRLPQDGGFSMMMEGQTIDFRVSTIPTIYGEKVVIRILKKSATLLNLGHLGFDARELELFRRAIHEPHGLILITGPTGSGKTTTLYAALSEILSPKRNISTIEDPVEYRLEGVNQVQTKSGIGLTFAAGLRAFLRQDPDVIMVGEIRDAETAQICVQASLTGHLVFSTLHTNDAPTAITRLIDIGVAPYLLSSTMSLVVAQRLMRKLCQACKESYEPLPAVREQFQITEPLIYRAKGCDQCGQVGYQGRIGAYEVMTMSRGLRELTTKAASAHLLKEAAVKEGLVTLWEGGLTKVRAGLTSLEELEGVVMESGA